MPPEPPPPYVLPVSPVAPLTLPVLPETPVTIAPLAAPLLAEEAGAAVAEPLSPELELPSVMVTEFPLPAQAPDVPSAETVPESPPTPVPPEVAEPPDAPPWPEPPVPLA